MKVNRMALLSAESELEKIQIVEQLEDFGEDAAPRHKKLINQEKARRLLRPYMISRFDANFLDFLKLLTKIEITADDVSLA